VITGVSRATAYRYVAEAVDVLSEQAPCLAEALERAMADGVPYMILDGKVFESDCWKAHRHGGNVQAVTRPDGLPLWAGPAEPGSVHDITAARWHALPPLYRAASLGMSALADSGYEGAGIGILVPFKNPPGTRNSMPTRTRNALLRDLRCRGERGFALLTQRWAALQRITADPDRTTEITRAALVLTQFEHKYIS
jgi:hypothetical protein